MLFLNILVLAGLVLAEVRRTYHCGWAPSLFVAFDQVAITDYNRPDPYENFKFRRFMISSFTGVGDFECKFMPAPYFPPRTRDIYAKFFDEMNLPGQALTAFENRLHVCDPEHSGYDGSPLKTYSKPRPLALFLPSFATSRHMYARWSQWFVEHDYVVVTIDNPGETNMVEFGDFEGVAGLNLRDVPTPEEAVFHTEVRVADIKYVLDCFTDAACSATVGFNMHSWIDVNKIFVIGHGLGASAATTAALRDDRIRGVLNFDGKVWGEPLEKGLSKPYVYIGSDTKNQPEFSPLSPEFYDMIDAQKVQYEISDTTHLSFWDTYMFFDRLRGRTKNETMIREGMSTVFGKYPNSKVFAWVLDAMEAVAGWFGHGEGPEDILDWATELAQTGNVTVVRSDLYWKVTEKKEQKAKERRRKKDAEKLAKAEKRLLEKVKWQSEWEKKKKENEEKKKKNQGKELTREQKEEERRMEEEEKMAEFREELLIEYERWVSKEKERQSKIEEKERKKAEKKKKQGEEDGGDDEDEDGDEDEDEDEDDDCEVWIPDEDI